MTHFIAVAVAGTDDRTRDKRQHPLINQCPSNRAKYLKKSHFKRLERSSITNLLHSWHMTSVEWKKIDVIFSYHQRMFKFGGTIKILVHMSRFIDREGLTGEATCSRSTASEW